MNESDYDLMIIGTGPGGIAAALYGQRMGLKTVVFGDIPGGSTYMIERLMNYPGFAGGIPGTEFGVNAFKQAQDEGAFFTFSRLKQLEHAEGRFSGTDANGQVAFSKSALVATGQVPKQLPVAHAQMKGVHFCSICDGPLFRGKEATLAVIGSDNAAGQHVLSLSRIAKKVYLICRSLSLKMDVTHQKLIEKQDNIQVMLGTEIRGYKGLDLIEGLVAAGETGKESVISVDGVFLAIGWRPNTDMLKVPVKITSEGYLKTDATFMTSFPGLFAAGDVRDTDLRQVLTACADGARAAKHAAEFIQRERPQEP